MIGIGILYAIFLQFQKDFIDFLLDAPLRLNTSKEKGENVKNIKQLEMTNMGPVQQTEETTQPDTSKLTHRTKENSEQSGISERLGMHHNITYMNRRSGSGGFLIILFYFFQDVSLLSIKTSYMTTDTTIMCSLKHILGGDSLSIDWIFYTKQNMFAFCLVPQQLRKFC